MAEIEKTLQAFGLSKKEILVYLSLLSLGPSPVRKVATDSGINRGTTHEAFKKLRECGLVSYYHKETRQYFVAEDPAVLVNLLKNKKGELQEVEEALTEVIPQLRLRYTEIEAKPVVKYYETLGGVRSILEDVLENVAKLKDKTYTVFSSPTIRPYLYEAYPDYTDERIKKNIFVRAISIGPGGKETGLDERRWLTTTTEAPTYTLIYAGRIAMISVEKDVPRGIIVGDQHLFDTQKLLFNWIWESLPPAKKQDSP